MGGTTSTPPPPPPPPPASPFLGYLARDFNACPSITPNPSATIDNLRPADFRYILSVGDSVSAGFDARFNFTSVPIPKDDEVHLGMSFVTGGDSEAFSMGKFMSKSRGSVIGGLSSGTYDKFGCGGSWMWYFCIAPPTDSGTGYNVAIPGGKITKDNYVSNSVSNLQNKIGWSALQSNDWKLIVVQTGFNDICKYCVDYPFRGVKGFLSEYRENLQYILQSLSGYKNTVVVLTSPFSPASVVDRARSTSGRCPKVYKERPPCQCREKIGSWEINNRANDLNQISMELANQYKSSNTFRVIYDSGFAKTDISGEHIENIVSSVDCFHPTGLAQAHFAVSMWNNLFRSSSQKLAYNVDPNKKFTCPTATDYIKFD